MPTLTDNQHYRCAWAENHPLNVAYHDEEWGLNVAYHDEEWGVPVHDENRLFEMLTLEGAQAGLSWLTILKKRQGYRHLFRNFDPIVVAAYDDRMVERLLQDASIVRHRGKIEATINNARRILALYEAGSSLDELLWGVVDGQTRRNQWHQLSDIPASTTESKTMSKLLKQNGFRFVGETTCYAFMQAAGLVNDHETRCFRYSSCAAS
jgi:DNA-3-methyladenine glycosylase I